MPAPSKTRPLAQRLLWFAALWLGGVGTVAIALIWMKLFPSLRNLERLE